MAEALQSRCGFLLHGSKTESILELILLLGIFVLVLVACVFTTRFVAGRQMQRGRSSNFKPIETYQITQNRYLHLVKIGTRYFVVSVTKENISFIAELSEEELSLRTETPKRGYRSFKDILSDFKVKVDKDDDAEE